ncbi:MAG TPA: hypothetical protein VKQ30_08360 [Ktedonobacterales bacterium]|nr:hypothetical protein [Ktedonobacterales bacterium]
MAGKQQQPQPQVIYVERKSDRGLLYLILFGWWYVLWRVLKWSWGVVTWPIRFASRVGWDVLVKWPWQATLAVGRWTVAGVRALINRQQQQPPA